MKKNEFIKLFVQEALNTPYFSTYKWKSSEDSLVDEREDGIIDMIELEVENYWNDEEPVFLLRFYFYRQFKKLHEWSTLYSFKSKSDLKYQPSIMETDDEIEFELLREEEYSGSDFEEIFQYMKQRMNTFNNTFPTMEKMYTHYSVKYILGGSSNYTTFKGLHTISEDTPLSPSGVDWIFEALVLTHFYEPDKFDSLLSRLRKHFVFLYNKGEPNAEKYSVEKFNEIVEFIRAQQW